MRRIQICRNGTNLLQTFTEIRSLWHMGYDPVVGFFSFGGLENQSPMERNMRDQSFRHKFHKRLYTIQRLNQTSPHPPPPPERLMILINRSLFQVYFHPSRFYKQYCVFLQNMVISYPMNTRACKNTFGKDIKTSNIVSSFYKTWLFRLLWAQELARIPLVRI